MPARFLYRVACLLLVMCALNGGVNVFAQSQPDSITVAVAPEYDKVSRLHRFFLGSNYRKEWAAPVKLRVMHLGTEKGGMSIVQLGGGMQTRSLRLQDASGRQWALRTLQKYPDRKLPANLKKTVARDILQDQVSTINPFAALTVPPLAQALGIPHSNPEIVYLADDPGLGEYRKDFANQVYLLEEREPDEAEKTYNTSKAQAKIQEDNEHAVDQKLVLRARLLDMLLGDWDRHEDQWRWERVEIKGGTIYKPIPRDRDQVYYKTSGVFPWIVSHQWLNSKFQPYGDRIRDIKGWNVQARYFDRYFLNSLSKADWKTEIAYVQSTLTDELITQALKRMPANIYEISGKEIARKMMARRSALVQQAMEYYRFLATIVEVPASDKREQFDIVNQPDSNLRLTIHNIKKDGTLGRQLYDRVFDRDVTQEIRLYGFAGTDVFKVSGTTASPIKVRMVGGDDRDSTIIENGVQNKANLYVYDRSDQPNVVPSSSLAKLRLSTDTAVNSYNKQSFKYDRFAPIILANYSIDNGVLLIGGFSYEKHGFRKDPYAYRHEFLVNYSLARKSFVFNYEGDFKKLVGETNLSINFRSLGPNNVNNFFGIGNESVFINRGRREIQYYRNRYDYLTADVSLYRNINYWRISAGLAGQFYTSEQENNERKFLNLYDQQNPGEEVFGQKGYAGFITGVSFDSRNNDIMPTQGMWWNTTFNGFAGIGGTNNKYLQLRSEFGFVVDVNRDSVLVITNRTGGGKTFGRAEFFQELKLGGLRNLRGFHTGRFTAPAMAYNNLEVRLKVLDFTSYLLPGSIGIVGFNDVGRVWQPGESSDRIHVGYGGGVYVIPARLLIIQALIGASREGALPYISIGARL